MNNDFKGFAEAVSILGRTEQLADDWQEVDRLLDRRLATLRDALGLDVGPAEQPSFCPVCGAEVECQERFCSEACAYRYYDDMEKDYGEEEKCENPK